MLVSLLLAEDAGLGGSFGGGQRHGEAGSGAEERRRTLPLERRLSFQQVLPAVGAGHVDGGRVDARQRFSRRRHGEHRADPQVVLSTEEPPREETTSQIPDAIFLVSSVALGCDVNRIICFGSK